MNEILNKIFSTNLKNNSGLFELTKLHGDASYRTYYRAKTNDGKSYIVMQMPQGKVSASEEITNFNGTLKELPFINIARFLKNCSMPVPEVFCYDSKHHVMIIEDLGDGLMAYKVSGKNDDDQIEWYKKAIELLCSMQQKTSDSKENDCVAFKRSFDANLLNWEFDHFSEYGIAAKTGHTMSTEDLKIFNEETRTITKKITSMHYVFTHRDFQSRNIIVRDNVLYLIDFQDALMGPFIYDLVALVRDSYVRLSHKTLDILLGYYAKFANKSLDEVTSFFDLVTVQRKLKDAGRFVYIDRVKGNPNFLQYIPTSLEYVKDALTRLPDHKRLYEVIEKYSPEWK